MFLQRPQVLHDLGGLGVAQHLHAHLRVGALHGNEQRADLPADDAVQLVIVDVGHRDVIAHHQGQAPVVILDVEGLAHARRHLIDEAEDAVVLAGAGRGHDGLIQRDAQGFPVLLADVERLLLAADPANDHIKPAVGRQGLIIDLVDDRLSGDGDQLIAFLQAQLFGDGTGLHMGDSGGHRWLLLPHFSTTQTNDAHTPRIIPIMRDKRPKVKQNSL